MLVDDVRDDLMRRRRTSWEKVSKDPPPSGREAETRLLAEIRALGLDQAIVDLELKGYTVIPPEVAAPLAMVERLRDAVLRGWDGSGGTSTDATRAGDTVFKLLGTDPVFEEALLNPVAMTLITYLLGYRAKLSQCNAIVKGKGGEPLPFHTDSFHRMPPPWPSYAIGANATWVLSDYTRENGCLTMWRGSHRFCRNTNSKEAMAFDHPAVVPIEAPMGSLVVWHGHTWHGAFPRMTDGHRVNLLFFFVRHYIQTNEPYWLSATEEMIARNPARFATLMGVNQHHYNFGEGSSADRLTSIDPVGNWHFE